MATQSAGKKKEDGGGGGGRGGENIVVLDKVFRQKDSTFQRLLNDLRRGVLTETNRAILESKVGKLKTYADGIEPTLLYATNKGVDEINQRRLKEIQDDEVIYRAKDTGSEAFQSTLLNGLKAPETLTLKVGAQVMLLKNLSVEEGLVNGARGVVTGFGSSVSSNIGRYQPPEVNFLVNVNGKQSSLTRVIELDCWDLKQGERVLARREQLPLMLAWAISIHKSQGMTIAYLNVSFQGMFEYGQAYVALSRATDLEGLSLSSFSPSAIKAHDKVKGFYASLGYAEESIHEEEETLITTVKDLASSYQIHLPKFVLVDKDEWLTANSGHSSTSSRGLSKVVAVGGKLTVQKEVSVKTTLYSAVNSRDPHIGKETKQGVANSSSNCGGKLLSEEDRKRIQENRENALRKLKLNFKT